MSIEEADKTLLEFYHYIKGDVHFCGYDEDNVLTTIEFVRETMRKYQKIQKIINNAKDSDGAVKYNWLYEQISGVM